MTYDEEQKSYAYLNRLMDLDKHSDVFDCARKLMHYVDLKPSEALKFTAQWIEEDVADG